MKPPLRPETADETADGRPRRVQVSWLQEFCEHLVENSLSRSLLQQSQAIA